MPVNRQTVPRAEREAEILEAALAEFAVAGLDGTTMAAVARRAGMTSANVHYYFPTKDALITAVTSGAYQRLFTLLGQLDDPIERLHRYVDFHLANHRLRGELQAVALGAPDLAAVLRERERWLARTAAEAAGEPLDADALAATVTGLIEVVQPHPDPRAVLEHAVARLVSASRRTI